MKKIFTVCAFLCAPFCLLAQVFEQFTNFDAGSSYTSGIYIGENNIEWIYTNARGNQKVTQNGDGAISFNKAANAALISDSISYGIKSLSFLYEQTLSTNCDMLVFVNDSCIGRVYTNNEKGITKSFSCDMFFEGNVIIKLQQASANSGQITIDDISITFAKIPFLYSSHYFTDTSLVISYTQPLQSITILSSNNDIIKETYIADNKAITTFNNNFCGEISFSISQCKSTENDRIADTTFSHFFYAKPTINDIVITEIMADPAPIVGLPDCEYIELYNRTNCPIQCKNMSVAIGSSTISLPDTIFPPQEYMYIIPNKSISYFTQFENSIGVPTFPSITNSGTTIALSYQGELISSISFTTDWYGDTFKEDGGWSLEKIDIDNISETIDNWSAATNKLGGTPGFANSVGKDNPDTTSPFIKNLEVKNDFTITVTFSENIDFKSFINKIRFEPNIQVASWEAIQNSLSQYELHIENPFDFSEPYTLFISENCTDFNGNPFQKDEYTFAKTDSIVRYNSITINEILFNPVKNQSDFIELYNTSSSFFDLSELFISNGEKYVRATDEFMLFPPHSYAIISADCSFYEQNNACDAIAINTSLPTMPDDAGTILLVNKWKETIDSLSYNKTWHAQYLSDDEGVSLEKLSPNLPSHLSSSWGSAAESAGFSTPGCENSQHTGITHRKSISLVSNVVTPNNDGENDQVILSFSDIEYGTYLTARVFSTSGRLINQFANNMLLGNNSIVQWDCTNSQGKLVEPGIYIIHTELLKNGKKISSEKICCTVLHE